MERWFLLLNISNINKLKLKISRIFFFKPIILGRDLSLYFDTILAAEDGNPVIKKNIGKMIEIKIKIGLCNICIIIYPEALAGSCSIRKGVLKMFAKFTGQVSLLIKFQASHLHLY